MIKQKQSSNKNEKSSNNREFMDIFENIMEANIDDSKIIIRRNSFTGKNIFQKIKNEKELNAGKLISEIKIDNRPEKKALPKLNNNKHFLSSVKLEITSNNNSNMENKSPKSNDKSLEISKISEIKSDNSFKTLKNNYTKIQLNEKTSKISSSLHRNFVLKSELFKTENSYKDQKESIKKERQLLMLLTNKSEKQKENQFYKYFIGNNFEEKIDFKDNYDNKKNIFSNTYIDNEEEEINDEKNKFKNMINCFDDKTLNEKYSIKENLMSEEIKKEEEIKQEKKLQEKVFNILKYENISNDSENNKESKAGNNKNQNNLNEHINNNINMDYPNESNNKKNNLIQYSIQNNYINNNFNIPNPKIYSNLNQGNYYPPIQSYNYSNSGIGYNLFHYNNPTLFNKNININPKYNKDLFYYYNNMNTMNNSINNQNIYNQNYLYNIDDIKLAKMSLNLIKTQIGCKVLKTRIQTNNKFANDLLFPQLKNNLIEICCDLSGNYLIQSLIDNLSFENLDLFLSLIQDRLFDICLIENGSRVIQKLIERISSFPLLLNKFIFYLNRKDLGPLFKSSYANHLIQKYLTIIKDVKLNNFIYNYLYINFMDIVISKYGVCVIQKGLSEGNDFQRKKIIDIILLNLDVIIKDCYGNFLIQFIFFKFDKNKFNEIQPIIEKIEQNIVNYCINRYSSSVIEKCFERNEIKIGERILNCLLELHINDIPEILTNSYGKYVIKKSFNFENNCYRLKMMNAIIQNEEKLKQNSIGEKIFESLKKDYQDFFFLLSKKENNL